MTGPEHYREAEKQLALVDGGAADWEPLAASAQVHATLALRRCAAPWIPKGRETTAAHLFTGRTDAVSWPDMMTPWAPAPADPLRVTILGGLACAALACRDAGDDDLADQFEDAYMQVAYGSAAWCDLRVKLISEMN